MEKQLASLPLESSFGEVATVMGLKQQRCSVFGFRRRVCNAAKLQLGLRLLGAPRLLKRVSRAHMSGVSIRR